MKIAKEILPMPDIKTEPMSPSKPVYFVEPKPEDYESESESDSDESLCSDSDSENLAWVNLDVSDSYDSCLEDCASDCTIPPPCLKGKPWIKAEHWCRHCGKRFANQIQRQLHEVSHLRTCDCGYFHYTTFEELHKHLPECAKMPTFKCEWNDFGCPAEFRSIRDLFHHSATCLYEINAPEERQIINPAKRRRLF